MRCIYFLFIILAISLSLTACNSNNEKNISESENTTSADSKEVTQGDKQSDTVQTENSTSSASDSAQDTNYSDTQTSVESTVPVSSDTDMVSSAKDIEVSFADVITEQGRYTDSSDNPWTYDYRLPKVMGASDTIRKINSNIDKYKPIIQEQLSAVKNKEPIDFTNIGWYYVPAP